MWLSGTGTGLADLCLCAHCLPLRRVAEKLLCHLGLLKKQSNITMGFCDKDLPLPVDFTDSEQGDPRGPKHPALLPPLGPHIHPVAPSAAKVSGIVCYWRWGLEAV